MQSLANYSTAHSACPPAHAGANCPPVPAGYSFLAHQDYQANDITCGMLGAMAPQDVSSQCDALPNCRGFNIISHVDGPGVQVRMLWVGF